MKPGDITKASSDRDGGSGDITGVGIETDRRVPWSDRATPSFRGNVSFASHPAALTANLDLYMQAQDACASKAIGVVETGQGPRITLDKGRCIMCGVCQELAPSAFKLQGGFARPVRTRPELIIAQLPDLADATMDLRGEEIGRQLSEKIKMTLGRSLAIREVDAGSCNGCETEVSALNNPIYDVERFGIHFVASPRHADVLLVTGVASRNMELALKRTYEATPDPKIVVAVGACACSGGLFGDTYASSGGIIKVVPVDVFVPGCPPRPEALLYGLLLAVDRIGIFAGAPDAGRLSERR